MYFFSRCQGCDVRVKYSRMAILKIALLTFNKLCVTMVVEYNNFGNGAKGELHG